MIRIELLLLDIMLYIVSALQFFVNRTRDRFMSQEPHIEVRGQHILLTRKHECRINSYRFSYSIICSAEETALGLLSAQLGLTQNEHQKRPSSIILTRPIRNLESIKW